MTGFYVYVTSAVTLTPPTGINPPPSVSVQAGWNLVGPSTAYVTESYADFTSGVGSLLVDRNQPGVASGEPPAADTTDQVTDGYACWLHTSQEGTLPGRISTPTEPWKPS